MIFALLWSRLRWLYLPASLLSVLLQRAPLVRVLATAESSLGSPLGALLRSAFTVAAVGGYHALAGATQLSTNPTSPATATVGKSFSMVFAVIGAPATAASYEVRGTMPPGLSVLGLSGDLLNASSGTLTGTPTTAGSFALLVRAWNNTNKRGDGGNPTFTITINVQPAAVAAPVFTTHPASTSVPVGAAVTLTAAATGEGTITYQWSKDGANLPGATSASLSLTSVTTASAGSYRVAATNAGGTTQSNIALLTVVEPVVPPVFTVQPAGQTVTAGATVTLTATATGTPPVTYQWFKDGVSISGATSPTLTLTNVTAASSGSYRVVATNAGGGTQSNPATLTVNSATAPVIVTEPLSQVVVIGASLTLTVDVTGTGPFTYQWRKAGVALGGATQASFTLSSVQTSDAGDYSVSITNAFGTVVSRTATLGVTPTVTSAITNVAVRTTLAANQILIVGFNVAGGSKPMLLRAVGPGLAAFGVPGTMPDPEMALFQDSTQLESNNNWGGGSTLTTAFASVGAFGLPGNSFDAALLSTVAGGRTAQVKGSAAGNVLVEAYDAGSGTAIRLTNVSARNRVGTGGDILIAGISISGSTPKTVLIRAVGPTLASFGVPGVLTDPKLEVFSGSTKVAENDTWSATLAATFGKVGAFGLADGSKDAAIVMSLAPGGYTVQVSGADGGTGEAIVEVYEVQP
ncbi:MAG: immunoglobulin domain-containing protein [Opitutaceae bacterium]|nr:immunoglobulin domain-containing protein [Opitutaceae bacterium]